uniref:Cationic amino acid transporter 1-like n=1 Tax=Nelumbo nucifera TaxID=4432 RepID=A0A822YXG4_NELNU|nr:TPA_asm: hypothetical protein HUJ06_007878 [Nelumbo nucifera]
MKKNLSWWDLIWLGIGAVIGTGIFVLTGQEARYDAGPAVVFSYVVSGISAMLSVFCYTLHRVRRGSFAYLRVELGDLMAFIAAGNILIEYVVSGAAVSRSWTSYFATLCNHKPDEFRIIANGLAEDYSRLDPIAVVIIAIVAIFASRSTKASSRINYVSSIIHVCIILFVNIAGMAYADIDAG